MLEALDPDARLERLDAWAREAGLVTESGRALRFVPAPQQGDGAAPPAYESRIFESGEVATRTTGAGARHDLYNAIAWLSWPRAKARLNALHARALARGGPRGARGPLRDAATLFDENAALWVGTDGALLEALRAFDWAELFVVRRDRLVGSVRLVAFGHALLEKLDAPYKAITAHAWPVPLPPDASSTAIDDAVADTLSEATLSSRALSPLPVMGWPGWCAANAEPAFYNDPTVFRTGRRGAPGLAR